MVMQKDNSGMQENVEVTGPAAGVATVLPRWVADPAAGTGVHELELPERLVTALDGLTGTGNDALLAAHAAVLAALTGDREVATGHIGPDGPDGPRTRWLTVGGGTWRALLDRVAGTATEADDPAGTAPTPYEVVLDLSGAPASDDLPDGVVLRIAVTGGPSRRLRLTYRRDALDSGYAERIAGYHVAALTAMAADPDRPLRNGDLVSEAERRFQLDDLAGPARELPDLRFHELFEQRVRQHPDRIAAEHAGTSWTYDELNRRANRVARAILARQVGAEGVVAVVLERNLDWLAAVLGILKAGAVYLPIEPNFPADRIAATLQRSGAVLAISEPGSTTNLDPAIERTGGLAVLLAGEIQAEQADDSDPRVPVAAEQLAYIYFTSGSTGLPKGAMCEHLGMLNHLYAKIDDLRITENDVVAQTAPQCFDISLWQLVAALLVGGRTLIVEQSVIMDVRRYVDSVLDGRVDVVQAVPSYLEVVLAHLEERPRPLRRLRYVSVTGEAVKKELADRWLRRFPDIHLVNAYGLTETSDDTNHEVLDRVLPGERVPLGRPVSNVHVYVVDEDLRPVPLGAPGEIVFSGICVGRGYINDEERTRAAFLTDPHRPGNRLYRSGDFGRWLPDGKLDFLGRRDAQIKIRGFRIEIGEIENTLLRVPGVRDAAVVPTEGPRAATQLVGVYTADTDPGAETIHTALSGALPEYMVPRHCHRLPAMPLTGNGKIDRKALVKLAAERAEENGVREAPANPTEQRLAEAWAAVLRVPVESIGRRDNFFDRGGTSLAAVRLVASVDRLFTLTDLTRTPVLADLAAHVDGATAAQRPVLLRRLDAASDAEPARHVLVCFPPAGADPLYFLPLAKELADRGVAVYGVASPGHDTDVAEPFVGVAQLGAAVAAEVAAQGWSSVALWGQAAGSAAAVATARKMAVDGREPAHLFVGGQLLEPVAALRRHNEAAAAVSDAKVAARLGVSEVLAADPVRVARLGAAYRHDATAANSYFIGVWRNPTLPRLHTRLTLVVGRDDPATAASSRDLGWDLVAGSVAVRELPDGGPDFLTHRPGEVAELVLAAVQEPVDVVPAAAQSVVSPSA